MEGERMRKWSIVAALFTTLFVACATGSGGDGATGADPVPKTPPDATRRPTTMVVIRGEAGFERGDTVRVDLSRITESRRVSRLDADGDARQVPLAILGPTGADTMVVRADRLNVHRCRSRGCTVLGYVAEGQPVQVHDFIGGWFRFTGPDGTRGYIHSDGLELLLLHRLERLERLRTDIRAYYRKRLDGLEAEDGRKVFSGYRVSLDDGTLSFDFFSSESTDSTAAICNAMRGIAAYVEDRMAAIPPGVFEAYSAGIYVGSPGGRGAMIAGLSGGGGVYCDASR